MLLIIFFIMFKKDFLWGSASAAYQIEGAHSSDGKSASIWDEYVKIPGNTFQNTTGEIAVDHYNRFKEDNHFTIGRSPDLRDTTNLDPSRHIVAAGKDRKDRPHKFFACRRWLSRRCFQTFPLPADSSLLPPLVYSLCLPGILLRVLSRQ